MREGIRAGLLGAGAAGAWVFVADVVRRAPLETPVRFGRALLSIDRVTLAPPWAALAAFTVFLLAVWTGVASLSALALRRAARQPAVLILAAVILILLELAAVDLTTALAHAGMGRSVWPGTFAAHLAGWIAVWGYLLRRHPGTLPGLLRRDE